ncbi:Transmembrane GTPase fzo1 [Wickerhamiella sorbophila]|uniref:Transmembrane GTPase fzo1 n=1 Tax=Wickerhamiella sorbophila TaxID=45607 RepID=A0A2T0FIR0_9ASCO|nr:Transmembrane GTPase fzo1 [Wickerhamiella sorbophila]PRT54856.1 Transmembrane GTPase fzo1 [Wickerhamiella sorbophila]
MDSKETLKPDAVSSNGVLEMLSTSEGHRRNVSMSSRNRVDAHLSQVRYSHHAGSLKEWLQEIQDLLGEIKLFSKDNSIILPKEPLAVLQLDLKMGASVVGTSLIDKSTATLLDSRLGQVQLHAVRLLDRISNTRSHVLITGDLNSGKSSLCNALLRRKILPVDQQPCTDVFCEVLDVSNNGGKEEVHAVLLRTTYDIDDPKTYRVFALENLDELVHESKIYSILKVYVYDDRPKEHSLLSNGVVDICLIDAPGLNVDVDKTQELFGRQEEIDLVIFVVSAENHLTQSSKEFIQDTAREKSLVFMVVNNYDKIRDKQRCQERILDQVAGLIPETHKGKGDFVHFVSSLEDRIATPPPSSSGSPPPPDIDVGPGSPDFDKLEASLRQFVLEKRSTSKLLPARNFLVNTLKDVKMLSRTNLDSSAAQFQELKERLDALTPQLDETIAEAAAVSDKIDKDVERLTQAMYTQSMEHLTTVVDQVGAEPVVEYTGLFDIVQYARDTRQALIAKIQDAVVHSEDNAREVTATAVDAIKSIGILHVGEQPAFTKVFQKSAMFSRRRDNLGRSIRAELSVFDFIDLGFLLERPLPVLQASKQALTTSTSSVSNALTLFSIVGGGQLALSSQAARAIDWQLVRKLWVPMVAVVTVGLAAYMVHEMPRTVPRKIARKIAFEIDDMGYVRANADRIAGECRKVLKYPSQDVRSAFQTKVEQVARERDDLEKHTYEAQYSREFFTKVDDDSDKLYQKVEALNLVD